MRAVLQERAGSADRLVMSDIPTPVVASDEVLVAIHAASVTRGDVVLRKLPKLLTRLVGETPKRVPGNEFAGVVTAVGDRVTRFETGDRVFGTTTGLSLGSHAEYVSVPEDGLLAVVPDHVTFEDAAPVPVGAMTALHFLRLGGAAAGNHVLINGASGSVGTFAVQIAKQLGAHVTGVCSASNIDLVKSLGAAEVIDYTRDDFTALEQRYDVIFDTIGKTPRKRAQRVLSSHGRFVSTRSRRKETVTELNEVRDLLETGAIKAVTDRRYPLEQISEAHRYVEQGHKRGNVIITLGDRS